MIDTPIRRLGCVVLLTGIAAASAQDGPAWDRVVGPMPSLAPVVERVAPAVVNIEATQLVERRSRGFGRRGLPPLLDEFEDEGPEEQSGAGSGVIVDAEQGYVLTNHHVIEGADDIQVVLADNRTFDAMVIGSDRDSDLAVLKIAGSNLSDIPFGSTADLRVGDYVVAIGNPFNLGQTVTSGVVGALGRESPSNNPNDYEDFIQTDAAINFGNSGGALVNLNGELIGINSAIVSRTGDSVGIGFAIPAEMVISVMARLIEFGDVPRGRLGVGMDTVTPRFAQDYGLNVTAGALVMQVEPDSAAESAGVQLNDVIVAINDLPVRSSNELKNRIGMMLPNERIDVRINRDGRERSVSAVLGARADAAGAAASAAARAALPRQSVLDGVEMMEEDGRDGGVRVISVADRNLVAYSLLEPGDLITAINRQDVGSVADAIRLSDASRTVVLAVERQSRSQLIRLRPVN